jgi:hypothetical protein
LPALKRVCLIIACVLLIACDQLDDLSSQNGAGNPPSRAVEGVLDLRSWDFERNGSVNLDGEWAFYWDELLHPSEFTTPDQALYKSKEAGRNQTNVWEEDKPTI